MNGRKILWLNVDTQLGLELGRGTPSTWDDHNSVKSAEWNGVDPLYWVR